MDLVQIERQRNLRQELEEIELALAQRFSKTPNLLSEGQKSKRVSILKQLEAKRLVDRYTALYDQLVDIKYDQQSKQQVLDAFAQEFTPMEQHPSYNLLAGHGLSQHLCEFTSDLDVDDVFSPGELYGQFLDLREFYSLYMSVVDRTDLSYYQYLESFPQLDMPLEYLRAVDKYLRDFMERAKPFEPIPRVKTDDPLFCTHCQRLFSTEGVFNGHLQGRKHKRAVECGVPGETDIKTLQRRIGLYCDVLQDTLTRTRADIKRQKYMTEKERARELELIHASINHENEGSHIDTGVSAPTTSKMPLGPDGKPIPHWLYKLNGLGHEFECEVCGNFIYNGRRAFERHFDENRHVNGLRCLGIENAGAFRGISVISEVTELQNRLKKKRKDDVEVEDEEGNVMTERVYQDLKKQGLL